MYRLDSEAENLHIPEPAIGDNDGGGSSGSSSGMIIAEVDSNATGGGYYYCFKQKLDATDWDTTNADQLDKTGEPAAYSATTTYEAGALVKSGGTYWESKKSSDDDPNLGKTPAEGEWWTASDLRVIVKNLAETPISGDTTSHELSAGDEIVCWSFTDDEGTTRLVGIAALRYTDCDAP